MNLPALRLAYLRHGPRFSAVQEALRAQLAGRVVNIPGALPAVEREQIVDTLVLFLDLPVRMVSSPDELELKEGIVWIVLDLVKDLPETISGSVIVCSQGRTRHGFHLDLPSEIFLLRDAVVECIGTQYSGTPPARIASWAGELCDSPATVLRFADGAINYIQEHPDAMDGAIVANGIGAAIGWLLRGVDVRVAEWVVATALGGAEAARIVDTDAALLGQTDALRRAFESGLIEALPDEPGEPIDLRRPFDMLSRFREAPGAPTERDMLAALSNHAQREVWMVASRPFSIAAPSLGLGLRGPERRGELIGREELLRRLSTLFEPGNGEVRTCVLHGLPGMGKTSVAQALADMMATERETVWVSFANGPESGWLPVAQAMRIDVDRPGAAQIDSEGVPNWVHRIHGRLRGVSCLLVVDDVDRVSEEELPRWLPSGKGHAAVLVLSRFQQWPLQRATDSLSFRLAGFSIVEARRMLAIRAPRAASTIHGGVVDALIQRVGGTPGALSLIAPELEGEELESFLERFESQGQESVADAVARIVGRIIVGLTDAQRTVLDALSVCVPDGVPAHFVFAVAGVGDDEVIDELSRQSLIIRDGNVLRMPELVRFCVDRRLRESGLMRELEIRHANRLLEVVWTLPSHERGQLRGDLIHVVDRETTRLRGGDRVNFGLLLNGAWAMVNQIHVRRAVGLQIAVEAFRALSENVRHGSSKWAAARAGLGVALSRLPVGNRVSNLREAITALTDATRSDDARGIVYANLSYALAAMPSGHPEADRNAASAAARKAIETAESSQDRESEVYGWLTLGIALTEAPSARRPECLREAVKAFENALTAPDDYVLADTHRELAKALLRLAPFDGTELLDLAASECQLAAGYFTRDEFPEDWAKTQNLIGQILVAMPGPDRAENIRNAIALHEEVLTVCTREDFPRDWARTHKYLAGALAELPIGDRSENLRRSAQSDRFALEIITPEEYPSESRKIREHLDKILTELAGRSSRA